MKSIAHHMAGSIRIDIEFGKGASELRGWAVATRKGSETVDREGIVAWLSSAAAGALSLAVDVDEREVAVVVGYDIMTDLQPIWSDLAREFEIVPIAKSPRDVYRLGLRRRTSRGKSPSLLIWDMRHMDARGVRAIGNGEGEGTGAEAEARALLSHVERMRHEAPEVDPDDVGGRIMTSTGMAREIAARRVGDLTYRAARGDRSLAMDYARDASKEFPRDYRHYAMRKACSRGGLVFCAASEAMRVHGRTLSLDESSAHHAQAIGRYVPEAFEDWPRARLQAAFDQVCARTVEDVLGMPINPWPVAFNACVEFEGLRPRPGTVWDRQGIGLVSTARLAETEGVVADDDPAALAATRGIRLAGYRDRAEGVVAAFGKIMSARKLTTWITDIEAWCMSRVYAWDEARVVTGEATAKRTRPDDMCILTSMSFYADKMKAKAELARNRTDELEEAYVGRVKARYNAIGYGVHARDELRPGWTIDEDGAWHMEEPVAPETYRERRPKRPRAWYTYGTRIAGWSRMQLVVAIELLDRNLGDAARILAGDTDSIKVETDLPGEDIVAALAPLHLATQGMIDRTTERARRLFPDEVRDMPGCGEFEVEAGGVYQKYYNAWTKANVGMHEDGSIELTLAGVPRQGDYSLAAWLKIMVDAYGFDDIVPRAMSFDCILSPTVSQVARVDFDASGIAYIEGCPYTLASTLEAEHLASLRWMQAHGREDIIADPMRYATWTSSGACFTDSDETLEAPFPCQLSPRPRR